MVFQSMLSGSDVPEEVLKMVNAFLPKTEAITQKAVLYGFE